MKKLITGLIVFSIRNRVLILFLTGLLLFFGVIAYLNMPIEAYPDVTNTRVRIIAQWPGRGADEVKKFVTLPIMHAMSMIPRKTSIRSISLFGLSVVTVLFDDMADAQAVIETAIGGRTASRFYEDIRIRLKKDYRDNEQKIGDILVPTSLGKKIPLRAIADIGFYTGPTFIYQEGNSTYVAVGFSIEGRDLGSTIREAQAKVAQRFHFPLYIRIQWAGEFESMERATRQLAFIIPVVLLIILFLLYFSFGSLRDTLIAATTIPYAFIGGFLALWATGTIFGISAGVGFIILFGVNTINSIILISAMRENLRKVQLRPAISNAVFTKIRPILMIALMGSSGLLPAALSTGMGSEVQKPIAIMIVGGRPSVCYYPLLSYQWSFT